MPLFNYHPDPTQKSVLKHIRNYWTYGDATVLDPRYAFHRNELAWLKVYEKLVDTLSLLLDDSPIHLTLSALPPPDFTNPTASNLIVTQELIHNTFLVLQEIIDLLEGIESERFKKEVETRRTRLGALPLDRLKLNVGREIWGQSKVGSF